MASANESANHVDRLPADVQTLRATSERHSAAMYWKGQRLMRTVRKTKATKRRLERLRLVRLYDPDQ